MGPSGSCNQSNKALWEDTLYFNVLYGIYMAGYKIQMIKVCGRGGYLWGLQPILLGAPSGGCSLGAVLGPLTFRTKNVHFA